MKRLRKLFAIAMALTVTACGAYALSRAWYEMTSFEATVVIMIGVVAWLAAMSLILDRR